MPPYAPAPVAHSAPSTPKGRWKKHACACALVLNLGLAPLALFAQRNNRIEDSVRQAQADSVAALKARILALRDSTEIATRRAIALRDTINNPRPPRPEQVRADRREHLLAAGAVALLASLTFLLYNLRTR